MYLVLKTTNERIEETGSVYEAVRGHWIFDPNKVKCECTHVIAVVDKVIQEVFTVDHVYKSTLDPNKFTFVGVPDYVMTTRYKGLTINPDLCIKGAKNPVRYVNEEELLAPNQLEYANI